MVTFIPNLRTTKEAANDVVQAYVDTPNFVYSDWLTADDNAPIGTVGDKKEVGIVGAGPAGCCAAYELRRCGYNVTLFNDSKDHNGGRLYSKHFMKNGAKTNDIAEMGAMRFPPTEEVLYHYFSRFGIETDENFPDPGKEPTWVSFQGKGVVWKDPETPPTKDFNIVSNGFRALTQNGITDHNGETVLQSPEWFKQRLRLSANNSSFRNQVITQWQAYINEFENDSWYSGLRKIFSKNAEWSIPGKEEWTDMDFTRFGALGIGSGGFGPLYNIGFLYIFRLLTNALETDQQFVRAGISTLCDEFVSLFEQAGGIYYDSLHVDEVKYDERQGRPYVTFGSDKKHFDAVIVATNTRAMEMGLRLSQYPPVGQAPNATVVTAPVAEAIDRTHVISSTKLFLRTRKFWRIPGNIQGYKYPRNLLSDTKVPQVYTLEYDDNTDPSSSGVVLLTYTWEDDAVKTQALSAVDRYHLFVETVREITADSPFPDYADQLKPFTGNLDQDLQSIDWQSTDNQFGAFTLARPGQDPFVNTMFKDFTRASNGVTNTGKIFIAGDCVSWTGGWAEGALQTGLNAASAVINVLGGEQKISKNPSNALAQPFYNYFPL